jgi:hypothetical protein
MDNIPLKVLVIDPIRSSSEILVDSLKSLNESVISVSSVSSLPGVAKYLLHSNINAIFIDPISLGLEDSTEFIFNIRKNYSYVVFVLYVNSDVIESGKIDFYSGKRSRFKHYYTFDKGIPSSEFRPELQALVNLCQNYLSHSLTTDNIKQLQLELKSVGQNHSQQFVTLSTEVFLKIEEQLNTLTTLVTKPNENDKVIPKSVFLSYRFAEGDYLQGLKSLFEREGFEIITGESSNTFISRAILERINKSEFFLCLMTKTDEKIDGTFTTSPWILEEKGAALALNKKIVMMVEEGVDDYGGLQGDWQRINFTSKSFTSAVIRAIDQLKSYGA